MSGGHRRSHFTIEGENLNGARRATITIEMADYGAVFSVRPHFSKKTYTLPLEQVARMVMWSVARLETAPSPRRRVRRGGGR